MLQVLKKYYSRLLLCLILHKVKGSLNCLDLNTANIVRESNTIHFLCYPQHLRSESCTDKLSSFRSILAIFDILVGLASQVVKVVRYRSSILSVQVGINLVEYIKWCGIRLLDSKDECKRAKTCDMLACVQLRS